MHVLSYNICHGLGMDGRIDLERIARVVLNSGAYLVALQEVDRATQRSREVDQFAWLRDRTAMDGVFLQTLPLQGGQYGIAVLSRFPIGQSHHVVLPGNEPRGALAVEIIVPGSTPFLFGCTHLDLEPEERLASVPVLETWCKSLPRLPFILCGDFNSAPDDAIISGMAVHWRLVYDAARKATYPADKPTARIDHIAVRPAEAWAVSGVEVLDQPVASDHRPLRGDVSCVGASPGHKNGHYA